jgi:hypothetical protein
MNNVMALIAAIQERNSYRNVPDQETVYIREECERLLSKQGNLNDLIREAKRTDIA